jgi:hypothetical protein
MCKMLQEMGSGLAENTFYQIRRNESRRGGKSVEGSGSTTVRRVSGVRYVTGRVPGDLTYVEVDKRDSGFEATFILLRGPSYFH